MVDLVLRPMAVGDEGAARAAHAELAQDGFEFLLDVRRGEPWEDYVTRRNLHAHGVGLADGFVPETFLLAEVNGELVGRTSIRHALNEKLLRFGGHIGYGVRPAHRRQGSATEILRQSLVVAAGLGVQRALLTCADGNVGSVRTIERCGGVLQDVLPDEDGGNGTRRFWIELRRPVRSWPGG